MKIFIIFFLLTGMFLSITVDARKSDNVKEDKEDAEDAPVAEKQISKEPKTAKNPHYTKELIDEYFKKMNSALKDSKDDPTEISRSTLKAYVMQIKQFINYEDIELETETYLWWFKKLRKNLKAMEKPKRLMELALLDKNMEIGRAHV